MASTSFSEIAACDWSKRTFIGTLLSHNRPALHYGRSRTTKMHLNNAGTSFVKLFQGKKSFASD